jgi:hypothetical protein
VLVVVPLEGFTDMEQDAMLVVQACPVGGTVVKPTEPVVKPEVAVAVLVAKETEIDPPVGCEML